MKFIEILDRVEPNWSIKEKARCVYENICKNISYDERFAYSQNKELLKEIYYRDINVEEDDEDTRLICRTACITYSQLLEKLGIKSKLIYKKSSVERPIDVEDVALVFWDEEGNKYYTNIAGDIQNCKYGLKTGFFGITKNLYAQAQDVKEIPEEELKQIDIKTGYIKQDYYNMVFDLLAEEVKNTSNFKKFLKSQGINVENLSRDEVLKNKLQYLTKLIKFRDKTAGPDEHKKFYQKLFCTSALDKFESKKFKTYEYVKENGKEVEVLSVIGIELSGFPVYYIYSNEEQTYIQITAESVRERTKEYREKKGKKIVTGVYEDYQGIENEILH